jgi:hypothetical protein
MHCRYCGQERKFVRSHAIPEAFFRVLRDGDRPPIMVSSSVGARPSRAPIGVYDRQTLCDGCEPLFCDHDSYGTDVLINRIEELFQPLQVGSNTLAFFGKDIDQAKLKMFFLAVLWRATISNQPFYSRVQIGPYKEQLLELLKRGTSTDPDEFSVVMSRWLTSEQQQPVAEGLMSPFLEKWDGVNAVRVYFGKVVAYIKIDKRPFPRTLRFAALGNRSAAIQIAREFQSSNDLAVMMRVARSALAGR